MVPQEVTVYYYGGCRTLKGGIRICTEEMVNGDAHIYGNETVTAEELYKEDSKRRIEKGFVAGHRLGYGNDTFRVYWKLELK